MFQLEQQLRSLDKREIVLDAAQKLGLDVISLLQAEDQEAIGVAYLRHAMVKSDIASDEHSADFTLRALKELGFIDINLLTTEVIIFRDENGRIILPELDTIRL